MTDAAVLASLDDRRGVALTIKAEAEGEPIAGRIAVGCVIRNRVQRSGKSWLSIVLAPNQFSCWRPDQGGDHTRLMQAAQLPVRADGFTTDRMLNECLWIADGILAGVIIDITGNSHDYFAPNGMVPRGRIPEDAIGKTLTAIGSQRFYTA